MPTVSASHAPQVHAALARGGDDRVGVVRHAHAGSCRRSASCTSSSPPWRMPSARIAGEPVDAPRRSARAPRGRGRRRTSTPSRRAAPAPCRCSTSPSRGGCAARASAARAAARASPSASIETPTSRPGSERSSPSRTAMKAACGPPKPIGTPKRCVVPTTTSAPISPGGLQQRRARAGRRRRRRARPPRAPPRRRAREVAHVAARRRVLQRARRSTPPSGSPSREVGDRRPRCRAARRASAAPRSSAGRRRGRPRSGCDAAFDDAPRDRHRLGRGRGLVEQRRVRDRQPGEVADHRLEVQQRLEPALRDLRLVRRVRRVPGRVLEHVAQDDLRRVRAVVAEADHRRHHAVAVPELAQLGEHVDLGQRLRHVQVAAEQDRARHGGVGELVERGVARAARACAPDPRARARCGGARTEPSARARTAGPSLEARDVGRVGRPRRAGLRAPRRPTAAP